MNSRFIRFNYRFVFIISIPLGIFLLYELLGSIRSTLGGNYNGLLSSNDVSSLMSTFGITLNVIVLFIVTLSYLKGRTSTTKFSNVCISVLAAILVIDLILVGLFFYLVIVSSGLFLLMLAGAGSILPQSFTLGVVISYLLASAGLFVAFASQKGRVASIGIWIVVIVMFASFLSPSLVTKQKLLQTTPTSTVTPQGSTLGWKTFMNDDTGVTFKYPSSFPTPEYNGIDGYGNPDITVQEPRKPLKFDIEIGQKTSDGVSCGECVPMSFDQSVVAMGEYLQTTSPGIKKQTVLMNGRTYAVFTSVSADSSSTEQIIFIPNEISPNNFAVLKGFDTDNDTLYLISDSLKFSK